MDLAIILAAGEGTRMKSSLPKPLHKLLGKTILEYVIDASLGAKIEKNILIVGHGADEIREYFKDSKLYFKEQAIGENIPYGTGYAVMQAMDLVDDADDLLILCGDTPLIRAESLENFLNYHKSGDFQGSVLTAVLEDASGYGRIIRNDQGNILKIVEDRDASEKEREVREINSGIFAFKGGQLRRALEKIDDDNAQGELYITDVIEIMIRDGLKVGAYRLEDEEEIYGVNSKNQLAESERIMRRRINNYHMSRGVRIIDPENTYIDEGVSIGQDSVLYPGVSIEAGSVIGEECIIRGTSRIYKSRIYDRVEIESSLIEESIVEEGTTIGPNAHLRPASHIGKNVRIGNFVEVKNSYVGEGSKAGHLAYIGDADIGKDVNIGCGVIFVNYNGREKLRTQVGDNSFIGSNANLLAPLQIADNSFIAAGSTITRDVPDGALAISRSEQVNKEGWVEKNFNNK